MGFFFDFKPGCGPKHQFGNLSRVEIQHWRGTVNPTTNPYDHMHSIVLIGNRNIGMMVKMNFLLVKAWRQIYFPSSVSGRYIQRSITTHQTISNSWTNQCICVRYKDSEEPDTRLSSCSTDILIETWFRYVLCNIHLSEANVCIY